VLPLIVQTNGDAEAKATGDVEFVVTLSDAELRAIALGTGAKTRVGVISSVKFAVTVSGELGIVTEVLELFAAATEPYQPPKTKPLFGVALTGTTAAAAK